MSTAARLQKQQPLGINRLEQTFRANTESRLMELLLFHFWQIGSTLEQVLFGNKSFGTIEPANLAAILSTVSKVTLLQIDKTIGFVRMTGCTGYSMGPRPEIIFPMFGDGNLHSRRRRLERFERTSEA